MGHRAQNGERREADRSRLERLESRLGELVTLLETMIAGGHAPQRPVEARDPDALATPPERNADIIRPASFPRARARIARESIRRRRKREEYFPPGLFAEPGWDILLDLYAAHYEDAPVSVSSLCIAAAVPQTTALRWIGMMTDDGWLVRWNDPTDGRRAYLKISEGTRRRLDAYFDNLPY